MMGITVVLLLMVVSVLRAWSIVAIFVKRVRLHLGQEPLLVLKGFAQLPAILGMNSETVSAWMIRLIRQIAAVMIVRLHSVKPA